MWEYGKCSRHTYKTLSFLFASKLIIICFHLSFSSRLPFLHSLAPLSLFSWIRPETGAVLCLSFYFVSLLVLHFSLKISVCWRCFCYMLLFQVHRFSGICDLLFDFPRNVCMQRWETNQSCIVAVAGCCCCCCWYRVFGCGRARDSTTQRCSHCIRSRFTRLSLFICILKSCHVFYSHNSRSDAVVYLFGVLRYHRFQQLLWESEFAVDSNSGWENSFATTLLLVMYSVFSLLDLSVHSFCRTRCIYICLSTLFR